MHVNDKNPDPTLKTLLRDRNTLKPVYGTVTINAQTQSGTEPTFQLPEGTYTIHVSAPDYTPTSLTVEVYENKIITIYLTPLVRII